MVHLKMGVSKNSGAPKSSILIGFSIKNHPFWCTSIFGTPKMNLNDFHHVAPSVLKSLSWCLLSQMMEMKTKPFSNQNITRLFARGFGHTVETPFEHWSRKNVENLHECTCFFFDLVYFDWSKSTFHLQKPIGSYIR